MVILHSVNSCYYFYILRSYFSKVTLIIDRRLLTATLKVTSATTKGILATEKAITTTLKVISDTTNVILVTEEMITATLKGISATTRDLGH